MELAESESATVVRGSSRFADRRACGGKHTAGGGREGTDHVSGMVAAGNRVHLDSKGPRMVRPNGGRKAGNVFVVNLWVSKDATSRRPGFHCQVQESVSQMKDRP